MRSFKVTYFTPFVPGVYRMGENGSESGSGFSFAFDAGDRFFTECGLILYDRSLKSTKIPFSDKGRLGNLYGLSVSNIDLDGYSYDFYIDDEIIIDPYARALEGSDGFGKWTDDSNIRSSLHTSSYDWGDDKPLEIPYEDSILYGLNVRSYTMHKSSKVRNKGTFEGLIEKIPYLKDLGVTAVVLMPCYEFDECALGKKVRIPKNIDEAKDFSTDDNTNDRINCWGFIKGFYFAPKSTYSASDDPVNSFKDLVFNMHKAGLEVIMQFYFPEELRQGIIIDALKYWVHEYHVDGFRINGFNIPYRNLFSDPGLKRTKLWFDNIPYGELDLVKDDPKIRNLSCNNGNYRYDLRRFIKGDEGMLADIMTYQRKNPSKCAVINHICDYDGFTLNDLYSYERKHNEDNGEENRDGNDINFSWNCGVEGPSRKKAINNLRLKEIKNALTMIILSAGTPYIFGGDEFLNTRSGNNNAYCQDNDLGYVKWNDTVSSKEVCDHLKTLIALRRENGIFRMSRELKMSDQQNLGFPDISYHGSEAYRPDTGFVSRILGIFYYGPYSGDKKADSFYVGINMHWEDHHLALPKLKPGKVLKKIIDTGDYDRTFKSNEIPIGQRSIVIYRITDEKKTKK